MTRVYLAVALVAAILLGRTSDAAAGEILIQFSGLDAVYDGFDLYDAGSPLGGNQDPLEADPLTSVSIFDDGVLLGTLTSDVYADFAIVAPSPIPTAGGTAASAFGGFFDLLTGPAGWGLGLDFLSFDLAYDGGSSLVVSGVSSSIVGQALPFGAVVTRPVRILLEMELRNVQTDGSRLSGFDAAGLGAVPEPLTLSLFGVGGLALAWRRRRSGRAQV